MSVQWSADEREEHLAEAPEVAPDVLTELLYELWVHEVRGYGPWTGGMRRRVEEALFGGHDPAPSSEMAMTLIWRRAWPSGLIHAFRLVRPVEGATTLPMTSVCGQTFDKTTSDKPPLAAHCQICVRGVRGHG